MPRWSVPAVCALWVICSCASFDRAPESGRLERLPLFSSQFVPARNVDIWLPADYHPSKRYAVLYMQDGQMLFDSSNTWNALEWRVDETLTRLKAEQLIRDCIVVGIWNGGRYRHSEYFPQKAFESLPMDIRDSVLYRSIRRPGTMLFSSHIKSDDYLRFIVKELKPYVDQHYSTLPDQKHTFIVGSSMGGLISLYAMCEYPEVFGGAACLSTHWTVLMDTVNNPVPDALLKYLDHDLPDPDSHHIYFDYGTLGKDAMYEPYQLRVDSLMKVHGYSSANWSTQKFEGADHSENSWAERLHIPLVFLLGR